MLQMVVLNPMASEGLHALQQRSEIRVKEYRLA